VLLKRLTLVGFKSFADRTKLEFDEGVTVVVGPNGSGKSNLLDAVAWVMGTQATRSLRTEKMEDVVFAGTATRPELHRAEVALTFANDDGFLPLDVAEVTITRRLYRDGTSDYELNGASCRLLDLQELLADGGVGRHQHVLVGQGQIGQILSARPEEHRAVIEEAAGITKHRNRRDRAVRRLESTDVDVARLHDILGEKRRLLRPLRRQANAAASHDEVRAEARALHVWLGARKLRMIRDRLAAASIEQNELNARVDADTATLHEIAVRLPGLREEAGEVGAALDRDASAAARLETVRERFRRLASVAKERRMAITGRIEGASARWRDLESELQDLEARLGEERPREVEMRSLSERREELLLTLEDEERSLAEQIQLPAEGVVANLRGDLRSLEAADVRDERERAAAGARRDVVADRLQDEAAEIQTLDEQIRLTDDAVTAAQLVYEQAVRERSDAQTIWECDEELVAERRLELAGAAARVDALGAALDGVTDPESRAVAEEHQSVAGTIIAHLDVPPRLAGAVDSALGDWREAFLTVGDDPVPSVAERLKTAGLGGVALLSPPAGRDACPAADVAASAGVDALVDLLGPGTDREVAMAILGDVVVVEGWSSGWSLVSAHPEVRAVTPEGDLMTRRGMRIATPDGHGPAALEAARIEHDIADRELARMESHRLASRKVFDKARDDERLALEHLEALEAKIAGHTEALALVQRSQTESEAESARLVARLTALDEGAEARSERMAELRDRLAQFEGEEAQRQLAWEALQERRIEVATRRDEARRLREEASSSLAAATERIAMMERRLVVVSDEMGRLDLLPATSDGIDSLRATEETAAAASRVVSAHVEVLRERQRLLREEAGDAGGRLAEAEATREQLAEAVAAAKDRSSVLAVELAEMRVREESTIEALRRDADVGEEEALVAPAPGLPDGVTAEERLEALLADLRRMGPINPLAAAEYEELNGEVELLQGQLADLEESRADLRKVIAALDDEMAVLFLGAFAEIASLYEENFAIVFPGGRGRLRLVDPEDPLVTGVEVEAQPHGKKVGRLSLLSGGERSLAALAFLFAVFRARPSPFYILDEVEAALDDANLHRFIGLVDTLRRSAQLVIITHQQQTMEAADMLYGVTMEPGESSKVLARRMQRTPA
jgi:chromosome segregation protein